MNRWRSGLLQTLMVGLVSVVAYAQDKPAAPGGLTDPTEILKKADDAAKAAKSVRYKATFKGSGTAAAQSPEVEGTVVMTGWVNNAPEKYRCDAKVKPAGSSDVNEITVGSNGKEYYLIDHKNKKAYVDMDPAVIGGARRAVRGLIMGEFVHPTPFEDEIKGEKKELRGSKTVGGEDCYEVYVGYSGGQEAVWHFAKKDFLPRGRQDIFKLPDGTQGGAERVITELVVGPKSDKDPFAFQLPEGYTKTDDFAP